VATYPWPLLNAIASRVFSVRSFQRGTAEQWIKEGKQAVKMTRLSCHRFRCNEVRLAMSRTAEQGVQ
jgi:hypothetical protein